MLSEMADILSYGGGALGIVGIVYFIIKFFFNSDDRKNEIIEKIKEEGEEKVKERQKEADVLKDVSDEKEKEQEEIKNNIEKTVDDYKKEKEEIDKSDSIENTVNIIEKEW